MKRRTAPPADASLKNPLRATIETRRLTKVPMEISAVVPRVILTKPLKGC